VNTVKRIFSELKRFADPERGFGMIEVVISIFLLAILALSFAPILINTIKDTARTTTIATATQLAGKQIEAARAVHSSTGAAPTCADVTGFLAVTPVTVLDPRGVELEPQWAAASCPSSYPGVVRAAVSVMRPGQTNPVASAVTLIFVASAGG
jgi:prepilin-type N-terminal cleavage/methylation domain-containing protein